MREQRVSHAGIGVRAIPDRVQMAERAGADLEQPDAEQHDQPDQQRVVVVRDDPVVDRVLHDQRRTDRAGLPEQSRDDRAGHAARLRAHDCAHESPRRAAAYLAFAHWGKVPTCRNPR